MRAETNEEMDRAETKRRRSLRARPRPVPSAVPLYSIRVCDHGSCRNLEVPLLAVGRGLVANVVLGTDVEVCRIEFGLDNVVVVDVNNVGDMKQTEAIASQYGVVIDGVLIYTKTGRKGLAVIDRNLTPDGVLWLHLSDTARVSYWYLMNLLFLG